MTKDHAAMTAEGCSVCGSNDTEHTPGEGCSYVPAAAPTAPFWGACGVEGCRDCFPLFNEANELLTDNFGNPL